MAIDCESCPLRDKEIFDPMTEAEIAFMKSFKSGELEVEAGTTLMMEGSNSPQLYTVLEGMGLRYKTMENGERQVINFVLPGDFVGMQAGVMREMQHSVEATTSMRMCVFDRRNLWDLFHHHPDRGFDLTWVAAVEEHSLGENLAVVGRMDGLQRIARSFVVLYDRGVALGMTKGDRMPLPYRQQDLADALGLSLVHTNKMLRKLSDRNIAEWKNGFLRILDRAAACELAEIEADHQPVTRPLI